MSKKQSKKDTNIKHKEQTKELCVHFDTKEHRISLEQFVQTVNSYEIVSNNIAEQVFGVKKGIKIYILPPKEGGFVVSMLLWLSGVAVGGIFSSIASDSTKGFISGVTKRLNPDKYPNGFDFEQAAEVLGDTVTGFMLETAEEIDHLEASLKNTPNIDISKKAKADFYSSCSRNKDILGIGFSPENKFSLKRADFVTHAVEPSIKPLPVKEELKELIIVKPVNVEEDLQWELKDKNTKESLTAKMADEQFKTMLFDGKCPQRKNSTPDVIIARVEYHTKLKNGKESKDEYVITDVYKFNRKWLKEKPEGYKLNKRKKITNSNGQLNLFDSKNQKDINNAEPKLRFKDKNGNVCSE